MRSRSLLAAACGAVLASFAIPGAAIPYVYIGNGSTHTLSVFDVATHAQVASVPIGSSPFALAASLDGTRVVVGNQGDNTVSVIETAGNTVVATLPTGRNPYGVAMLPDGSRAYVASYDDSTVTVIDLATNTVSKTIAAGLNASGVASDPQGMRVYVSNGGANSISVIDPASDTVVSTIANVGVSPWGIVFSPDGTRAYVADYSGADVAVIDTATATVVAHWAVGTQPAGIAINGDGSRLYTANTGADTVTILDAIGGLRLNDVSVGRRPFGVAADPDGRMLYVSNAGDFNVPSSVVVLDGAANVVVGTLADNVHGAAIGRYVSPFGGPGAPTQLNPIGGDGQISLGFTAPDADGGSPISQYTATCGDQSRNGNVSPILIDGLTNGQYVPCSVYARNAHGRGPDSGVVYAFPSGKPGAPQLGAVQAGDASVSVAFQAPASDGGLGIDYYVAQCGSASQSGSVSPLLVSGLANGVAVRCHVLAHNPNGNGPASAESASVTPLGVPDAPTLQSATRSGDGADLSFAAPADDGGGIDQYLATCQPGGASAGGTQSPLHVSGLDADTGYSCSVTAANGAGTSVASNALALPARPQVDLAVRVDDGTDYVSGGSVLAYTLHVENLGAEGVSGARVLDDPGATVTAPSWTCSGSGGGHCPASGSGAVDVLVDLPAGASVDIVLQVHVPTLPETPLSNSASVSVPVAYHDTNAANDTAADGPDTVGLFRSRFE